MDTTALTDLVAFALGTILVWLVLEPKMAALRIAFATEQGRTAQLTAELAATRDQFAAERQNWNDAIGSFDSRLTVTALKIVEMTGRDYDEERLPVQIEIIPAAPQRLVELPPGG